MNGRLFAYVAGRGVVAGAAGGIAEIIWIFVYATATGTDSAWVARGVTTATGMSFLLKGSPAAFGVAIHMMLAATLGIALAFSWTALSRYWPKQISAYAVMPIALLGVWAVNFLIVLPLIDPNIAQIVPYPVSLISKLLFGVAAEAALSHRPREPAPLPASK